jgi:hypothetical protein
MFLSLTRGHAEPVAGAILQRVAELEKGVVIIDAGGGLEGNALGPTLQINSEFFLDCGTEIRIVNSYVASLDCSSYECGS